MVALAACGGVEGDEAETEAALTNFRFHTVEPTPGYGTTCVGNEEDCVRGGGSGGSGGVFVCGSTPDANGYTTCTAASAGAEQGSCVVVTTQCYHNNGTQTCHTTPPQTVCTLDDCSTLNR